MTLPRITPLDITIAILALGAFLGTVAFTLPGAAGAQKRLVVEAEGSTYLYDLGRDQDISIAGPLGDSLIRVEDSQARFVDSPCRDKLCVHVGHIFRNNQWAACLPNGIIIRIEGFSENNEEILPDASAF